MVVCEYDYTSGPEATAAIRARRAEQGEGWDLVFPDDVSGRNQPGKIDAGPACRRAFLPPHDEEETAPCGTVSSS